MYQPVGRARGGRSAYVRHTFKSLDEACTLIARGLLELGLAPGAETSADGAAEPGAP